MLFPLITFLFGWMFYLWAPYFLCNPKYWICTEHISPLKAVCFHSFHVPMEINPCDLDDITSFPFNMFMPCSSVEECTGSITRLQRVKSTSDNIFKNSCVVGGSFIAPEWEKCQTTLKSVGLWTHIIEEPSPHWITSCSWGITDYSWTSAAESENTIYSRYRLRFMTNGMSVWIIWRTS